MVKFNLDLPYPKAKDNKETNKVTTINLVEYFIGVKHKEIKGQLRRIYGRLQGKIDGVRDIEGENIIELETAEVDFIYDLNIPDLECPAQWSKYVVVLEDEVRKLRDNDNKVSEPVKGKEKNESK